MSSLPLCNKLIRDTIGDKNNAVDIRTRERVHYPLDNDSAEYVLLIHRSDGTQIECFQDMVAFRNRLDVFENQLETERWHAISSPVVLRDGWKV